MHLHKTGIYSISKLEIGNNYIWSFYKLITLAQSSNLIFRCANMVIAALVFSGH
jgi:hypothetical protein